MNASEHQILRPVRVTAEWMGVAWDVGVMLLVVLDLLLIVFDTLFGIGMFAGLVRSVAPAFHDWYAAVVYPNFAFIDLCFVAIFATDVLFGWMLAIWRRTYYRWFFYPFVHWYDVLGCIPLAGFRWLRVLRIITLGIRLQRLEIIDVRGWRVYMHLRKYYDVLVEEISDRVVENVLHGMQQEVVSGGTSLQRRVLRDVIEPRRDMLAAAISQRVGVAVDQVYSENRAAIRGFTGHLVQRSVEGNAALANLERIPGVGSAITRNLERAIRDSVYQILDEAVDGLQSSEFDAIVNNVTESVIDLLAREGTEGTPEINQVIVEILDLVIDQVRMKRWKQEFE